MPRRGRPARRLPPPDARYHSLDLARFINKIMCNGKKSTAERIVYRALDIVEGETKKSPVDVFCGKWDTQLY